MPLAALFLRMGHFSVLSFLPGTFAVYKSFFSFFIGYVMLVFAIIVVASS